MGLGVRGGNGKPEPGAKREKYRLSFVDDGDNVNEVHKDYVVMASPPDRSDSVSELKQKQFPS